MRVPLPAPRPVVGRYRPFTLLTRTRSAASIGAIKHGGGGQTTKVTLVWVRTEQWKSVIQNVQVQADHAEPVWMEIKEVDATISASSTFTFLNSSTFVPHV